MSKEVLGFGVGVSTGPVDKKGLRQSSFFYLKRLTPIDVGRFIFSLPRGRGKQSPQNILATKIFEQPGYVVSPHGDGLINLIGQ